MLYRSAFRITILAIAAILGATVITVAACAPASPNNQAQSGDPTKPPTPLPTNTPRVIFVNDDGIRKRVELVLNQSWNGRDRGDAMWIGHLEC